MWIFHHLLHARAKTVVVRLLLSHSLAAAPKMFSFLPFIFDLLGEPHSPRAVCSIIRVSTVSRLGVTSKSLTLPIMGWVHELIAGSQLNYGVPPSAKGEEAVESYSNWSETAATHRLWFRENYFQSRFWPFWPFKNDWWRVWTRTWINCVLLARKLHWKAPIRSGGLLLWNEHVTQEFRWSAFCQV